MSSADDKDSLNGSSSASESETQPGSPQIGLEEGEEPRQTSAATKPALRTNMLAQEVLLQAIGVRPAETAQERKVLSEETASVLVGPNGGIIRLSIGINPGQLLLLTNLESKVEIIAQVKRKRMDKPTFCYVEIEFAEPPNRFWGRDFSAATALLPRDPREAEAAARILSAEAIGDDQSEPPPVAAGEEVRAFRQEIDGLLGRPSSIQVADTSEEASGPPNAERAEPLANATSFVLPQFKRQRPRARGSFTPGFRTGALRLAILSTLLVITVIGAAWYKHWIPWHSAAKKTSPGAPVNVANAGATDSSTAAANLDSGKVQPAPAEAKAAVGSTTSATGKTQHAAPRSAPPAEAEDVADSSAKSPPQEAAAQPSVERMTSHANAAEQSSAAHAEQAASEPVVASAANGNIVPPKLIKSVRATATMDAVRDFETGSVVISAVVGTSGQVESMTVISGPPSLRNEAMKALKQYRYEPATQNGQPVAVHITVTIRFQFEP